MISIGHKVMVSLGDREPEETLLEYQYVYRTLREGYVYILCNPTGNQDDNNLEIMVYEVTYSGAMRLREFRDVKGSRPKEIPLNCIEDNHNIKGMFITIDNRVYDKAWVAYSSIRWKLATVKHYRENKDERLQRFSEVDLTKRKASELSTQERGFAFNDFVSKQRHLLEMECDDTSVLDYFDEKGRKVPEKEKSPLKGKTDKPTSFIDSVRQGIFNEKGFSLQKFINLTAETFANAFQQKFFTASHFNSLSSKEADKAITKTVSAYESDYNYSTEISALVVEDSMGLAEELSIQRRQKLAPVVEGFMNQTAPKGDQQKEAKQFDKLVRSSTHDLIYDSERTATKNPIATAMQARNGRDKLAEFFQKEKASIKSHPIKYFEPEIAYARRQYQQIEQYKALIRSPVVKSDVNESYLFLFYISANNYDSSIEEEKIYTVNDVTKRERNLSFIKENNFLNYYATNRKKMSELNEIDKIRVSDAVGEELLAIQLGVSRDESHRKDHIAHFGYMYCRYLSLLGLEDKQLPQYGLGEYKEYKLTPEQQQQLLALYKMNNKTRRSKYIDSVKVVHFYNLEKAKESYADKILNGDWDKRKKRLNQPSLENFEALEKTGKESLTEFVANASKDYYNYLMWLFGESSTHFQIENQGETANKISMTLPSRYNQLPFWRNELLPDLSDRHIGFFYTFLLIIDSASLGTLTLPEHSAFWGMLLNNEESIYFYLFGEKSQKNTDNSSQKEDKPSQQGSNLSVIQYLAKMNNKDESTLSDMGLTPQDIFDTTNSIMDLNFKVNLDIGSLIVEKLINSSVDGATRAMQNNIKINQIKLQTQYFDIISLFKLNGPEKIRQYKVRMSINGLNQYLKKNHELMPFFNNTQMTTNKGSVINLVQSQNKNNWHIQQNGNKSIGKEVVEINMLVAFENQQRLQEFEKGFTQKGGLSQGVLKNISPNIIEVNGVTLDANEINYLSETLPRQKRYMEIYDTSKNFVLGSIGLYFQATSLKDMINQLDKIQDPASKAIMKFRVLANYTALIVSTTEIILKVTKLLSVAFLKSSSSLFMERVSRLAQINKALNVLKGVANVVNVIDSMLSLAQAIKSFNEGNTGSGVICVTGVLSLILSFAASSNCIPLWGQILFIIITVGILIINAIYYDNGDDWDEFSKWLNRCMLGNFDFRQSKYPPYYLPTPKCMLLSDQDYYLAVRNGRCLLEAETSLLDDIASTTIGIVGAFEGESDLKLTLNLPDFNSKKSVFEGTITIKSLTYPEQTPVELTISRGLEWLEISPVTTSSFFIPRTDNAVGKDEVYDFDKAKVEPAKEESLWNQLMAISHNQPMPTTTNNTQSDNTQSDKNNSEAPKIGLYLIKWSLGQIRGNYDVTIRVNYWPEGKQEESGDQSQSDNSSSDPNTPKPVKELTPYLLSHHYIKD
ncbi:toxin VasX [Gilliamella sp. Lep-s35]|uniref:toxin VasX n=1 Tax=Gilliamella sp. Lep-s35 TaxID=2687312 RepID=UPI0013664468|nr:toxin VasX [Gilliamella sp. Lep-s35]